MAAGGAGVGTDERHIRENLIPPLAAVCEAAGFDHRGARLIRYVGNAVFQLPRHPVVVRIVVAPVLHHRVPKVVAVARWLAAHGVPAVRLVEGLDQPVDTAGYRATFWHAVPPVRRKATGSDLARLLRMVHRLPDPPFALPDWDPLAIVRSRLGSVGDDAVDPEDRAFLERLIDRVEADLAGLSYPLPRGPIHGDAYLGNLISGPDGPVLCDFDSTCIGPREWDLTPMGVGQVRLGHPPREYRRFAAGYGFDVMRWPGFEVLRRVRELKMVAGGLPILDGNPMASAEFARRVRTLQAGERNARWAPYK
jgi:aminoglycoside phosphotransferase (APT) family kinase protein